MTRYDNNNGYDSPISLYDVDGVVPTLDTLNGEQRNAQKNRMTKQDMTE